MINRGMKQEIKQALFNGFFWTVYVLLFGLLAIKFIVYVIG